MGRKWGAKLGEGSYKIKFKNNYTLFQAIMRRRSASNS